MNDLEPAEGRQYVAVDDGSGGTRVRCQEVQDAATLPDPQYISQANADAGEIIRVNENFDSVPGQLPNASDVVRVSVSADDPIQLVQPPPNTGQITLERAA
jgi:hypothetical protein